MISIHVRRPKIGAENTADSLPDATVKSSVMSAPLSILIALLKLTAQCSGAGCCQFLYAMLVLGMATVVCLLAGWTTLMLGLDMLRNGSKIFNALIQSSFFGVTFFLMWFTMMVTFFCGRRRTGVLLEESLEILQDISICPSFAEQRIKNGRRTLCLLIYVVLILAIGLVSYIMIASEYSKFLPIKEYASIATILLITVSSVVFASSVMIAVKFALFCSLFVCGIETVNSELKTLAEDDGPVSWSVLRRLRLMQARLSRGFSRVTEQLRPELISAIFYGTLAQVMTIFQLIGATQQDQNISIWGANLFLLPALVFTLLPSWSCQRVLDASEGTRAALLTVEPQDAPADRQLAALLAAARRDLETFGDLGFFRLQLSAILGTTSTVLTYIIIMVQFQMSENGCGDSGGHQGNATASA